MNAERKPAAETIKIPQKRLHDGGYSTNSHWNDKTVILKSLRFCLRHFMLLVLQ